MKILLITLGLILLPIHGVLASQLVRYNISQKHPNPKQQYYIDVLKLALEETKQEYGPYHMEAVSVEMS